MNATVTASRDYKLPAIASVVLAALFPIYWLGLFNIGLDDFYAAYRDDLTTLTFSDILFVIIGLLEIYVYLSIREKLMATLNSHYANICLIIMTTIIALFHATVLIDIYLSMVNLAEDSRTLEAIMNFSIVSAIALLFAYGIVAILFGIFVLSTIKTAPGLLKLFAVILLIAGIFQLTLFLAAINIVLFPLALIFLAGYFYRDEQSVEVV